MGGEWCQLWVGQSRREVDAATAPILAQRHRYKRSESLSGENHRKRHVESKLQVMYLVPKLVMHAPTMQGKGAIKIHEPGIRPMIPKDFSYCTGMWDAIAIDHLRCTA